MRFGICIRSWGERGGIGVYTRQVLQHMIAMDPRNEYVLFHADPEHVGVFRGRSNVTELHVAAPHKLLWDQVATPREARRAGVDVILHPKLTVPLLTTRKTVMVLHGTERFYFRDFHPKSDRLYFRTLYPLYLRRASKIIAVSERARQDMIQVLGGGADRIRTIYMAVDPIFRAVDDEEFLAEIREKYALPPRYVLYVGHIYPGKNVGRLFRAFAKVRAEQDVKLVVAGAYRWKYEQDMAVIDELGIGEHVQVKGHVPPEDLVGFYNMAELTAFPSFYESFGLTNLEANVCGCPLVASSGGGSREAAGEAALYVDPLDVDGLAAAMLRILGDPALRRQLVEAGFENAKRFSWERCARETLETLEALVGA